MEYPFCTNTQVLIIQKLASVSWMLIKTTSIHPDVAFPAASVSPAFETYLLRFRALQVCSCCTNTLASYSSRGNEPRFIGIERILRCIHAVRLPVLVWSAYKIHLPEITAVFLLHQYPSFQLFKTRSVSSYGERKRHQMSAMLCGCLPPVISTIKSPSNDHRGLPPVPLHWPLEIQKLCKSRHGNQKRCSMILCGALAGLCTTRN